MLRAEPVPAPLDRHPAGAALPGSGGLPGYVSAPSTAELLVALDGRIALWGRKSGRDVDDYISAANLGALRLTRAKLTSSADDYSAARAAIDRALKADPGYQPARQLDATLRFTLHDFSGALAAANAMLRDDPTDLEALATRGDAQLELGDLDAANATYTTLGSRVSGPAVDLRLARLAFVTGDPALAVTLATSARDGAIAAQAPDVAIYQVALGEIARMSGRADVARDAFTAALGIRRDDTAALLGFARLDAAVGDGAEALGKLQTALGVAPVVDALVLEIDVATGTGDIAAADDARATLDVIRRLAGPVVAASDRTFIRYDLDHGRANEAVLDAARRSLAVRPDATGHDLVAWALHRVGRDDEAKPMLDMALATGVQDARLLYHAGAITMSLGDPDRAREFLRQALALGPALDPGERMEAAALLGS
jgi:tetratricopeptide (TPR) repeat protein